VTRLPVRHVLSLALAAVTSVSHVGNLVSRGSHKRGTLRVQNGPARTALTKDQVIQIQFVHVYDSQKFYIIQRWKETLLKQGDMMSTTTY